MSSSSLGVNLYPGGKTNGFVDGEEKLSATEEDEEGMLGSAFGDGGCVFDSGGCVSSSGEDLALRLFLDGIAIEWFIREISQLNRWLLTT